MSKNKGQNFPPLARNSTRLPALPSQR